MRKLFIGNIPHSSSEAELGEWLESQGYRIESAEIIRDRATGHSRGFGFVVLNEASRVQEAIVTLHGRLMGGRPLTVKPATPKGSGPIPRETMSPASRQASKSSN